MARLALILLETAAVSAAWAQPAHAHAVGHDGGLVSWVWAVATVGALALCALLYGRGLHRLWSRAEIGAGIRRWRAAAFATGWVSGACALLSPLDRWGEELFFAHMVQHEVLMLIAAPLFVLGRPTVAILWAFRSGSRRRMGRLFGHSWWSCVWRPLTHPLAAWTTYALVLWTWHAPVLFEAAIVSDGMHALQHVSFFGASLLFWWAFIDSGRPRSNSGVAVLANFTTAVHSSLLGAFLTFSSTAWYAPYLHTTGRWGLTPLEDQQLGGLIMWVPGGLVHLAAGLAAAAQWMHEADARAAGRPAWLNYAGEDRT